jgi:hypothetical protein
MRRAVVVLVAGLIALLAQAVPASAHTPEPLYGPGSDGPNWATVTSTHRSAIVHDGHCGGTEHVARIDWRDTVYGAIQSIFDANGCSSGDGFFTLTSGHIEQFRLCVGDKYDKGDTDWCTGWRTA